MSPNGYEIAWKKLRQAIQNQLPKLADGTPAKITALQILFTMDALEPEKTSEGDV